MAINRLDFGQMVAMDDFLADIQPVYGVGRKVFSVFSGPTFDISACFKSFVGPTFEHANMHYRQTKV